jgi:riboflavin synthase
MFTGLVDQLSVVEKVESFSRGMRLRLKLETQRAIQVGDSIAVDGVCLTVVSLVGKSPSLWVDFEISPETISKTHWTRLKVHDCVNVEFSLRVGDALGGHFVSGHVDGLARITDLEAQGEFLKAILTVENPLATELQNCFVDKGSVTIDGVSLTLNKVFLNRISGSLNSIAFEIMLIPETQRKTRWANYKVGDLVHIEGDLFAKHISRHLTNYLNRISRDTLRVEVPRDQEVMR